MSVFDSSTACVHVDESNHVAYTPFPMQVLERLADACQEVKKRLGADIRALNQQTPEAITNAKCHDHTAVGRLITGITGEVHEEVVRGLVDLNAEEQARLRTLRSDLGNDPARVAGGLELLKGRLDYYDARFRALQTAVSDESVRRLAKLCEQCTIDREAAKVASSSLFADDPLSGIGSEVWRRLWEAARDYSERLAYPDTQFPVTGKNARCVLCHHELDAAAADRLSRFEQFVKDETKQREELSTAAYQAALDELAEVSAPLSDHSAAVALVRDELNDVQLAGSALRAAETIKDRLDAIIRNHTKGVEADPLPVAESWPSEQIAEHAAALSKRISVLRAEEASEERKQMRNEFEELADREWLAVVQDDVIAEINRRKQRAALEAAVRDTATNRITTKSREVAEQLVTNALRAQFSKEIDKFGVANLAIELRQEPSRYGVPSFQVSLIRKPDARVGEILSEGEHRCGALAAFLAELATTESRSAIVFDDPVSSLDHTHREAVANR